MAKIINIELRPNEDVMKELQDMFNSLGSKALYMDHYELALETGYDALDWKMFLMDPRVKAFLNEESDLLKQSKATKMLKSIGDGTANVGQAQLLNTLLNQTKETNVINGPVFIYCAVPLNDQEKQAENVVNLDEGNNP